VLNKIENVAAPVGPRVDWREVAGVELLRRAVVGVVDEPHVVDNDRDVAAERGS
jgi:hypothetical protein